jgi:hypothetical protein
MWVRNFQIRAGFSEIGSVEKPHDSVKVLGKALQKKENFPAASVVRFAIKAIRWFVKVYAYRTDFFPSRFGLISLQSRFPFFQNSPL